MLRGHQDRTDRIISAHAENRIPFRRSLVVILDHLRACGEQPTVLGENPWEQGSSPRMRRTAWEIDTESGATRIISAHAENRLASPSSPPVL